MALFPTTESVIGKFINGRNATDDFLQLASNRGGNVFGWIDAEGHLQGSLLFGVGGISFVPSVPALCTPGLTPPVELSVSPFTIFYCSALNTWSPVGAGVTSVTFTGDGTVLSATPSAPVTTTGTLTATLNSQTANTVLSGPSSGPAAAPTFRALAVADLPASTVPVGVAGNTAYFTGTNSIVGGTVELDMAGIAGADLGAKMNNCATQLPAAGGKCKGDNLTGALVLSTAVTTAKAVVYTFCGQSISQSAAVILAATNSAVIGCPGAATIITKAGNIDQFTLSGIQTAVKYLQLSGAKGSFTGNGIVTATGAAQAVIEGNVISAQANDAIKDNSATFSINLITGNTLHSWGVHGFESTLTSQQSIFTNNVVFGDGSSTGAAVLNNGSSTISNNYIVDSNGVVLLDDSTAAQGHPIVGNRFLQTSGWPAINFSTNSIVTGNTISAGGAHGPAVTGQGTFSNNFVSTSNADGIDIVGGASIVEGNNVNMAISGVSNKCAINVTGDQINVRVANNQISVGGALGTETNYGICDTPTSGHNLNIIFDGNTVSTSLAAGAAVFGLFLNNAANLNTNWAVTFQNNACVHMGAGACMKRIDTQNNKTLYTNTQPGDATLDNGTGGTNDVFAFDNLTFTFATLPTPVGNGSHLYCSNCTQAKPTGSGGGGAFVVYEAGQWNGL
jgi:hypothetical protein